MRSVEAWVTNRYPTYNPLRRQRRRQQQPEENHGRGGGFVQEPDSDFDSDDNNDDDGDENNRRQIRDRQNELPDRQPQQALEWREPEVHQALQLQQLPRVLVRRPFNFVLPQQPAHLQIPRVPQMINVANIQAPPQHQFEDDPNYHFDVGNRPEGVQENPGNRRHQRIDDSRRGKRREAVKSRFQARSQTDTLDAFTIGTPDSFTLLLIYPFEQRIRHVGPLTRFDLTKCEV